MAKAKKAIPEGYHTVTAVLTLDDAKAAIAWYGKALGAEELARSEGPDGKITHGEIRVGDSRVMVNDAVMGGKGPRELGGSPASLWVYAEDCDKLYNSAVQSGATVAMPLADMFWGDRFGSVVDPFGYRWSFATRKEDLTPAEMAVRADAFYKEMAAKGGGKA
jgi:PhnB protein